MRPSEKTREENKAPAEEPGGRRGTLQPEITAEQSLPKRKAFFNGLNDLAGAVSLPADQMAALRQVEQLYHVRITDYYLSLIQNPDDLHDPIRRQCVPAIEELQDTEESNIDPLGEETTSPVSCLVHRYPDRALLLVTGRCFMYCRHCTRKRLWKENQVDPSLNEVQQAIDYIREHPAIREVIISGGDPLTLSTDRLDCILDAVSAIPHVEVVRIGTRTPVVYPQRIDKALCAMLGRYPRLWINMQFNHPREVTPEAAAACQKLQRCGIPLSNQSVLLKGINDDPAIMTELCQKLQSIRVRPYYLFQCDPVVGAAHFRTSVFKGVEIMEKMRGHTSGMCIPVFVVDGPDGKGKIPLGPNYLLSVSPEKVTLRNYQNKVFDYINPD